MSAHTWACLLAQSYVAGADSTYLQVNSNLLFTSTDTKA